MRVSSRRRVGASLVLAAGWLSACGGTSGADGGEAGAEAAVDAGFDAGTDGGAEAGRDASVDVPGDATPDRMEAGDVADAQDALGDAAADVTDATDVTDGSSAGDAGGAEAGCTSGVPCSGACVDTQTDVAHCGGCDVVCPAPVHGSATCAAAQCGVACDSGYAPVGGACMFVDAPRPIAPLSTATVTSRRPTLRWSLAAMTDGAHVELCADRGCLRVLASFDAAGSSGTPTADLPPGVVFWRLRGRAGSTNGTAASPTWEFTVGARTATADTSWGSTLDVNGDGYPDAAVGAPRAGTYGTGQAYVYLGGAGVLSTSAAATLAGTDAGTTSFGQTVASAGDVDGDGYPELLVGDSDANGQVGRVYLYRGGPLGLATTAAWNIAGPDAGRGQFGFALGGAGDVNGDGYADVVVGAPGVTNSTGRVYVFLGSSLGLGTTPAMTIDGPDGAYGMFGTSVAGAGDVNGDGFGDVVAGAPDVGIDNGRVYVFLGGAAGPASAPSASLAGPGGQNAAFGGSVANAGDVNGDGLSDVLVGAYEQNNSTGAAYVYTGSATTGLRSTGVSLIGPVFQNTQFGWSVAGAGDVNGDGYGDALVGAPGASSNTGAVYIYFGGASGIATSVSDGTSAPDSALSRFGSSVAALGDMNGDGMADVLAGGYGAFSYRGAAYVFQGSTTGIPDAPDVTLTPPGTGPTNFGYSVATQEEQKCSAARPLG